MPKQGRKDSLRGHKGFVTKHGQAHSPLHHVWLQMRQRCLNPRHKNWHRYGGRGITVCERWNDFANFVADMGPRPEGMELERVNNNGPYSPDNCVWAGRDAQMANQEPHGLFLCLDGERDTITGWSKRLGWPGHVIQQRIRKGWSVRAAITTERRLTKRSVA